MPKEDVDVQSMVDGAAGLISNKPLTVPANPAAPAAPAAPVAGASAAPAANPINPIVVNTPLGQQVYGGVPIEKINLASFADVQAFAKDFLGRDIKEVKDFVPLFSELKQAKEIAATAAQLQTVVDNYNTTIENLPSDVSLILRTAIQGEDYKPIIQNLQKKAAVNYDKQFESHDVLDLVNHYTGTKYTKETFDTLDPVAKNALTDSVKLKYNTDRNEVINFEANAAKATKERQEKFQASVESSITKMLVSNPQMDKAAVDRVRQIMTYGIANTLFTKDRTYTPDAAEKIAMMEYGKQTIAAQSQTIGEIVARMTNQGVSKATENLLLRSDKPGLKGDPKDINIINSIVERETDFLPKKNKR